MGRLVGWDTVAEGVVRTGCLPIRPQSARIEMLAIFLHDTVRQFSY
jgi:hypothetical protein